MLFTDSVRDLEAISEGWKSRRFVAIADITARETLNYDIFVSLTDELHSLDKDTNSYESQILPQPTLSDARADGFIV